MVSSLPLIRYILLREQIHIVHGHSAFSALAHETMMIGRLIGLKVKSSKFIIFLVQLFILGGEYYRVWNWIFSVLKTESEIDG